MRSRNNVSCFDGNRLEFNVHTSKRSRGFTLIELMVVMVLLGLISSIALTTVGGGNQKRELLNEVNRLHAVLRMGAEEAVFNNIEIGVLIDDEHYEFLTYDEEVGQWEAAQAHFLRSYTLPEWISLSFQREGKKRKSNASINL